MVVMMLLLLLLPLLLPLPLLLLLPAMKQARAVSRSSTMRRLSRCCLCQWLQAATFICSSTCCACPLAQPHCAST